MGSLLISDWLADAEGEPIVDEASIALARERVRERGAASKMPDAAVARMVNVASELAHNQLRHARGGHLAIVDVMREGAPGLEIVAVDRGPGIEDPAKALRGEPRIPDASGRVPSLGVGLAAVLELSDEVDFDVRLGEGTCVRARGFGRLPVKRREVGIYSKPHRGERASGDDATFIRKDGEIILAVADGLGHGELAREASSAAMSVVRSSSELSLPALTRAAHERLADTRGAVLAVARVDEASASVETLVVGNVGVHIYGPGRARRETGPSLVLGSPHAAKKLSSSKNELGVRDVLVLFTDGISSRADLEGDLDLLREHPIVIAHRMLERFGRDTDDTLVAVIR